MVEVSGHVVEPIPEVPKEPGLKTVEVRKRDENETARPQQLPYSRKNPSGSREMLEHMPEADHVKRSGSQTLRVDVAGNQAQLRKSF